MLTKALVAVRSGSVRVVNKNIRPFAGSSLLEIKLRQLRSLSCLDGVVVNSNDRAMLEIAENLGCETVLRDEYFASNYVSMNEVYRDMAEHFSADTVVYANVTNPLISGDSIAEAVHLFEKPDKTYDSVNTAHFIKEFMFLDGKPINYNIDKMPRSQDLPDIMALNFACSVISREEMIAYGNVIGKKPFLYNIPETEATDIDNEIDFEFAEYLYRKNIRG
jgi:CMP-N-acetylneuraminic acid synthetase